MNDIKIIQTCTHAIIGLCVHTCTQYIYIYIYTLSVTVIVIENSKPEFKSSMTMLAFTLPLMPMEKA